MLLENFCPRARQGKMLLNNKGRKQWLEALIRAWCTWGLWVRESQCLKGKESTRLSYLHGSVKCVGKEERLVLDTLDW